MSKAFQRIEQGVSIAIGKPVTWLFYLAWRACCWCSTRTWRLVSWLRQRLAKRNGATKQKPRSLEVH